ncbi:MAG: T9SS type A sorting domain-containing protein [Chitinophagaceae bacterium]|nr:T9SS type A sorting domain-containing protein [Chitinophagaceae bacterium]
MKQLFTLLLCFLISTSVFAGQGGPDTWGYTWKDSNEPGGPVYNWIDIVNEGGVEVKLLGDDNSRGPFPMNFDFRYYWYDVNTFWVGSNGYLLFQNGQLASPFTFGPSTALPNDVLGIFMNDLTFAGLNDSAECYYKINAAKDTLIVSWVNVPYWDAFNPNGQSGNNTFQLILSKVDSSITFQYKEITAGNPYNGANSSVGIENYSGSLGLWYNQFTYTSPPASFAIKYYPPTNPTLQVNDAATIYLDNPETGAIFLTNNGSTAHDLKAQVKNYGTVTTAPFNVQGVVKDPMGTQVVSNFFLTDTLNAQETQNFTFVQQLNPALAGTYKYFTVTQLPGDYPQTNNSKTQEIVTVDPSLPEIRLGYDGGITNQLTPLNWVGGEGGAGTYIIPPFYPAVITKIHYWNLSNAGSDFSARVFDDDGINGLPYSMYDSIYVSSPDVVINGWTDIVLDNPVTITSGGFYLSWDMHGTSISLGMSLAAPFSNRSFEVFNNGWGILRYRETQDPLINATVIQGFPTGITSTATAADLQMQLSPNPASDQAIINYTIPATNEKVWLTVTDLQGKLISRWNIGTATGGDHTYSIDTRNYAAGMYLVELFSGKIKKMEKLVVGN